MALKIKLYEGRIKQWIHDLIIYKKKWEHYMWEIISSLSDYEKLRMSLKGFSALKNWG